MFAPYVKEFWFADIAYFGNGTSPEHARPFLNDSDFLFTQAQVEKNIVPVEEWREDNKYRDIEPCTRTEAYVHKASGQEIHLHFCRRRGPTAMRKYINDVGVFFFRGCSNEGSSTLWLTANVNGRKGQIEEMLEKLVDGGLIVTDGSMCEGDSNPYRELRRFCGDSTIGARAVELVNSFEDPQGRRFCCVGYAGEKYGPTLIWQVSQKES
jgi:hypothetical protein